MNKLFVIFLMFRLSLRWIPQINLGDEVWWRGSKYTVFQMVCYPGIDIGKGNEQREYVQIGDVKKVRSIRNYVGSFRSAWWFYRTNWQSIWEREGIKPWMRNCNIWGE